MADPREGGVVFNFQESRAYRNRHFFSGWPCGELHVKHAPNRDELDPAFLKKGATSLLQPRPRLNLLGAGVPTTTDDIGGRFGFGALYRL